MSRVVTQSDVAVGSIGPVTVGHGVCWIVDTPIGTAVTRTKKEAEREGMRIAKIDHSPGLHPGTYPGDRAKSYRYSKVAIIRPAGTTSTTTTGKEYHTVVRPREYAALDGGVLLLHCGGERPDDDADRLIRAIVAGGTV